MGKVSRVSGARRAVLTSRRYAWCTPPSMRPRNTSVRAPTHRTSWIAGSRYEGSRVAAIVSSVRGVAERRASRRSGSRSSSRMRKRFRSEATSAVRVTKKACRPSGETWVCSASASLSRGCTMRVNSTTSLTVGPVPAAAGVVPTTTIPSTRHQPFRRAPPLRTWSKRASHWRARRVKDMWNFLWTLPARPQSGQAGGGLLTACSGARALIDGGARRGGALPGHRQAGAGVATPPVRLRRVVER